MSIVLVKGQKSNLRALLDSFKNQIVAHLFVPIVNIRCAFAHEHCINKFLRRVAILVNKTDLEVEVSFHLFDSFGEDYRVDKAYNTGSGLIDKIPNARHDRLQHAPSLVRTALQGLLEALARFDAFGRSACAAPSETHSTVLR